MAQGAPVGEASPGPGALGSLTWHLLRRQFSRAALDPQQIRVVVRLPRALGTSDFSIWKQGAEHVEGVLQPASCQL